MIWPIQSVVTAPNVSILFPNKPKKKKKIPLPSHLWVVGSTVMMAAVDSIRHGL